MREIIRKRGHSPNQLSCVRQSSRRKPKTESQKRTKSMHENNNRSVHMCVEKWWWASSSARPLWQEGNLVLIFCCCVFTLLELRGHTLGGWRFVVSVCTSICLAVAMRLTLYSYVHNKLLLPSQSFFMNETNYFFFYFIFYFFTYIFNLPPLLVWTTSSG